MLKKAPGFAGRFLVDGKFPEAGTVRRADKLSDTLDQLAHAGLDDFYRGDVGRELAADLEEIGAPLVRDDFTAYRAVARDPLELHLQGRSQYHSPPPTQGRASLLSLAIFARLKVA